MTRWIFPRISIMRMKNRPHFGCKHPKTRQEAKQYYNDPEYVRPKRNPKHLPNAWDDKFVTTTRSWKDHRKTQYVCEDFYVIFFEEQHKDRYSSWSAAYDFYESLAAHGYAGKIRYAREYYTLGKKKYEGTGHIVEFRGKPLRYPNYARIVYQDKQSIGVKSDGY